jgi:hypothetical protein
MVKIKYLLFFILLLSNSIFADSKKIYFYTTEANVNDFKSLKVTFEQYLSKYGDYDFQPFNKKELFEQFLEKKDIIVILSSWHYKQIAQKYNLEAKLVALKRESVTDTKIIVGKKGLQFDGTITTTYSKDYSKKLIDTLIENNNLNIVNVPKEIDALMSVGFGLSKFALVSKDSFELLKNINGFLAEQMTIYKESKPNFRMLIASKLKNQYSEECINLITSMNSNIYGKKVLNLLGIDNIVILTKNDYNQIIGGVK